MVLVGGSKISAATSESLGSRGESFVRKVGGLSSRDQVASWVFQECPPMRGSNMKFQHVLAEP